MQLKGAILCALAFLLFIASCSPQAEQRVDNVIVTVNKTAITEDDLALFMQGGHAVRQTADARARAIEELINQELLFQQGIKLGFDRDPRFRNQVTIMEVRLREYKRAELARQVASTKIAATVDITDKDTLPYYRQNEPMITTDLRIYLLRFASDSEAQSVSERLAAGESFEAVARRMHPRSPGEARPVWDYGYLHWNQLPAEWAERLFTMSKGEVSRVLDTPGIGFCIVKIVDRKKNPDASFEAMNASIMNRLRDARIHEAYDRYLARLRKESEVVIHQERRNAS